MNTTYKNLIDEQVYEWREVFRWIKYEQTINIETSKWNRPFVGALLYQSLLYLKTGLQYGTVLLKCDRESFFAIVDDLVEDFIDSGHLNKENRDQVKKVLLSNHSHNSIFSSTAALTRKKSTISEFLPYPIGSRRQSTFTNENHIHSESTSRKNSSIQFSDFYINKYRNSTTASGSSTNKKLSISEDNLEKEFQASLIQKNVSQRGSSVKFSMPSNPSSEMGSNADYGINNLENNININSINAHKNRRRSTMALIKNSLGQSKLNKVSK